MSERQTEPHQAERPRVSDITPAWMNYADRLEAEVARLRAERDEAHHDAELGRRAYTEQYEQRVRAEARVAELKAERDRAQIEVERLGKVLEQNEEWREGYAYGTSRSVVQDRVDRAVTERTADLQAAVDKAYAAMNDATYVGGPTEREAWRTAFAALGEVVTQHKGQDEFPAPDKNPGGQ